MITTEMTACILSGFAYKCFKIMCILSNVSAIKFKLDVIILHARRSCTPFEIKLFEFILIYFF